MYSSASSTWACGDVLVFVVQATVIVPVVSDSDSEPSSPAMNSPKFMEPPLALVKAVEVPLGRLRP